MMILIITTTMRIIEVNPEAIDLIDAKILDNFSGRNSCGRGQRSQKFIPRPISE